MAHTNLSQEVARASSVIACRWTDDHSERVLLRARSTLKMRAWVKLALGAALAVVALAAISAY